MFNCRPPCEHHHEKKRNRTVNANNLTGRMSQQERVAQSAALIALAEQLGAVQFNRWVADGMLCRRYITPDGSIDLTVRVP